MRNRDSTPIMDAPRNNQPHRLSDPRTWVDRHGDVLFRFALLRMADPTAAGDAVQETLIAALSAADRFEGGSAEWLWLIGIIATVTSARDAPQVLHIVHKEQQLTILDRSLTGRRDEQREPRMQ